MPKRRETATGDAGPQGFALPPSGAGLSERAMADDRKPVDKDSARAERLARALRENLKRRKAQARGRAPGTKGEKPGETGRQK